MPAGDLILDTGGWLMALAGRAPWSEAMEDAGRLFVPGLVLAEVDYHLRHRRREMWRILDEVSSGEYAYEPPTTADLRRAIEIDRKFASAELGIVDASIAALAERLGIRRVLTTDSDMAVVRFGERWHLSLELAVPLPKRRH